MRELGADGLAAIEEHFVAGGDLAMDGAGDDIARRQFAHRGCAAHETPPGFVDQDRAFAAQGFGGQRRGIAPDGDRGGMELHEFRIGDHGTGARRHAQAFAAGFGRIGGHGIERAQAARCEDHDCRCAERTSLLSLPAP